MMMDSTQQVNIFVTAVSVSLFRMAANKPHIYMGQMSVSDVIADVWKSCIYMPTLDATFNATWYFTGKMPF